MPFQRTGEIDRTPAYMKRAKSVTNIVGYVVEGAGICNGFYMLKGKAYDKQGSEGKIQMKKLRKEWVIRVQDEDNDWVNYFTCQQPKPKPPESGWRNAFDKKHDDDVKVKRTLLKNLTEEQIDQMKQGETLDSKAVKLDEIEAKPAETPQQMRARLRMEKRKAKMEARRNGGGKKKKKPEENKKKSEKPKEATTSPKSSGKFTTPAKKTPEREEENVEEFGDILTVLFKKLQPRYSKYEEAFREFGVSDVDILSEVDADALVDLGVSSKLEQKVILKTVKQVLDSGGASIPSPGKDDDFDPNEYKQQKLKRTQLQSTTGNNNLVSHPPLYR